MSLSVNPVCSNVSFRAQEAQAQNIEDILMRPGAYSRPESAAPDNSSQPHKKHKILKYVAGVLVTAGVIAGALYGLKRGFPEVFKVAENLKDLKGMEKFKGYLTTGVAKGAEYVEAGAQWVASTCTTGWDKFLKLIRIKK